MLRSLRNIFKYTKKIIPYDLTEIIIHKIEYYFKREHVVVNINYVAPLNKTPNKQIVFHKNALNNV